VKRPIEDAGNRVGHDQRAERSRHEANPRPSDSHCNESEHDPDRDDFERNGNQGSRRNRSTTLLERADSCWQSTGAAPPGRLPR
jgi:hypothetical protein